MILLGLPKNKLEFGWLLKLDIKTTQRSILDRPKVISQTTLPYYFCFSETVEKFSSKYYSVLVSGKICE